MPWRHCTHHLNFLNQSKQRGGNMWRSTFGQISWLRFPGKQHILGFFFFKVDCFLVTSWKVKLRSMISGQMKWSSPKKLQHWVHFYSQIWSNHFCHTSGNLYHISDKNAYRLSKSQHSSVTSIFSSEKTWISPYKMSSQYSPNTPMHWTSQQKPILESSNQNPRQKGKNCPSFAGKNRKFNPKQFGNNQQFEGCFWCSRNKSLVQILSLEISWDQVPFSKMVLSWRTFAYPVCPLWNWQKVPENRPHPKRNCSSWLWYF